MSLFYVLGIPVPGWILALHPWQIWCLIMASGLAVIQSKKIIMRTPPRRMKEVFSHKNVSTRQKQFGLLTGKMEDVTLLPKCIRKQNTEQSTVYVYYPPSGLSFTDFERVKPELEMALNQKIFLSRKGKAILVEVYHTDIPRKIHWSEEVISAIQESPDALPLPLGYTPKGFHAFNLAKAPHGLAGGPTGCGKSNLINSILIAWMRAYSPDELALYLVDFKQAEFLDFEACSHVRECVYDLPGTAALLEEVWKEYERRRKLIVSARCKNISTYNGFAEFPLPRLVVVVDEYADIAPKTETDRGLKQLKQSLENSFCELARKARFVGIHLLICTQRPTVDVISGNIKANLALRICFATPDEVNSRVILDNENAARLAEGEVIPGRAIVKYGGYETEVQIPMLSEAQLQRQLQLVPSREESKPEELEAGEL